jgi:hypothetical protein
MCPLRTSKQRGTAVPAVTAGTSRAPASPARLRPWVVAAAAVALVAVLCVRNRFLFTSRLYEDADMGANSILVEQARHFTLLVGNYSRDHFHHPGPAYMYVKAAGESLFWAWLHVVPSAWNGQLLAVYALNAMFVALAVGVVYGWTGRGGPRVLARGCAQLRLDAVPVRAGLPRIPHRGGVGGGGDRPGRVDTGADRLVPHSRACELPVLRAGDRFRRACRGAVAAAARPWRRGAVLLRHAAEGMGPCGGYQRRFRLPGHRGPGAALARSVR